MKSCRSLVLVLLASTMAAAQVPVSVPAKAPSDFRDAANAGRALGPASRSLETLRAKAQAEALKTMGVDIDEVNRPWQMFLQALVTRFNIDASKSIQFVTAPQPADWNDKQYGRYRTTFYGDALPKWGAVFSPQTGSSFADVYGTFINSIAIRLNDSNDQKKADNARLKWNNCAVALQNQYKLVGKHWKDFNDSQSGLPPGKQMGFDQWHQKFEAPHLKTYEDQCNALAVDYNSWFNKATQGNANLANAILRYSSAKQISALLPGSTDQYESVWPYSVLQSLDAFVSAAEAAPQLAFDQTFKKGSGTYSATTSSWGASASYGWFFRGSGGGSSSTVDTHNEAFALTIQLKGLSTFDFKPGDWFSQQLVQFFKHGPFEPNSIIKKYDDAGVLYGEGGVFSLRSTRYIVAYKPRIVLSMSSSNYHEARSSWSAGGGLSIGPFSFGASGGGSSTSITWDEQSNSVTVQDSSPVPQVIGVILDVLPDFK